MIGPVSGRCNLRARSAIDFSDTTGYDFLCTFPGHWQMMRGVMKVEQ